MMKVFCDCCGKELFETTKESRGAIASEAAHKGFIAKMPLFYGTPEFKIFCSKECWSSWKQSNITPEQQKEGDKSWEKLKEDMNSEELIKGLQDGLAKIQKLIKTGKHF